VLISESDVGARIGQGGDDGTADTPAAAGHETDFSLKFFHVCCGLSWFVFDCFSQSDTATAA
jgi:hypothetical protein